MKSNSRYNYAFSLITVIATISVVMLHGSSYIFYNTGDTLWKQALLIQAIFIPAVPLFFMMSGANLLAYSDRYSTKEFFIKRTKKVGMAFFAFSFIWYIYTYMGGFRDLSLINFLRDLSNNNIQPIFWYFYSLCICYLATPILTYIAHNKKILEYLIIVLFILGAIVPFVNHFTGDNPIFIPLNLSFLVKNGLLYYVLGYYIKTYVGNQSKKSICIMTCLLVALMVASYYKSLTMNLLYTVPQHLPYNNFWIDAFGLNVTVYSVLLFVILSKIDTQRFSKHVINILKYNANASLIVYGIHYIILNCIDAKYFTENGFILLVIRPIIAYIISVLVALIILKTMSTMRKAVRAHE